MALSYRFSGAQMTPVTNPSVSRNVLWLPQFRPLVIYRQGIHKSIAGLVGKGGTYVHYEGVLCGSNRTSVSVCRTLYLSTPHKHIHSP
jgi:hypothetical protein